MEHQVEIPPGGKVTVEVALPAYGDVVTRTITLCDREGIPAIDWEETRADLEDYISSLPPAWNFLEWRDKGVRYDFEAFDIERLARRFSVRHMSEYVDHEGGAEIIVARLVFPEEQPCGHGERRVRCYDATTGQYVTVAELIQSTSRIVRQDPQGTIYRAEGWVTERERSFVLGGHELSVPAETWSRAETDPTGSKAMARVNAYVCGQYDRARGAKYEQDLEKRAKGGEDQ